MQDEITQAVLAREDVARYLHGARGEAGDQARARIEGYLEELRTTQRYPIYRALKHPLYPILRKIERRGEHVEIPKAATAAGRVIYVSNHKSHTDYLVEPLVLDDNGIRPPVIAAGINLFGGPLGLLHRHVTGAIPIRRNAKDPAYLVTLKAYVAELLRRHDLFFYLEGGRSYSGEMKAPKTGLLNAAMHSPREQLVMIPTAIAYDLVLEDAILANQVVKRGQRPFALELAEMIGSAVGYQSRAIVTFGEPIPLADRDPSSRSDVLALAHELRNTIGRLHKVMPTALVCVAMRPSMPKAALEAAIDGLLEELTGAGANLAVKSGRQAVEEGVTALSMRGVLVVERDRVRVRDRRVLRYYARSIEHLLSPARRRP